MDEYVSREELRRQACCIYSYGGARYVSLAAIEKMATADVTQVVHGRWLNFYNNYTVAECDQCGHQFDVMFDGEANGALWDGFKQFYKFCPNCGAKMDKEA